MPTIYIYILQCKISLPLVRAVCPGNYCPSNQLSMQRSKEKQKNLMSLNKKLILKSNFVTRFLERDFWTRISKRIFGNELRNAHLAIEYSIDVWPNGKWDSLLYKRFHWAKCCSANRVSIKFHFISVLSLYQLTNKKLFAKTYFAFAMLYNIFVW